MNRLCFYVCMLLVIDIHGMENIDMNALYNELFPTIHEDVEKALNLGNVTIKLDVDNQDYALLLKIRKARLFNDTSDKNDTNAQIRIERTLFCELINIQYPLAKRYLFRSSESNGYISFKNTEINEYLVYINIYKNKEFNGLLCNFIKENIIDINDNISKEILSIGLAIQQATYKINLMPTKETILNTVIALFQLLNKNPKINNQYYLKDLIHNININIDLEKNNSSEGVMPIIVIDVPNIFIDKQYKDTKTKRFNSQFTSLFSEQMLDEHFKKDTYTQFIDYKKSKHCTQDLLAYLVYFFSQHTACKGSGIVPRFNAKVTDMIFFAQGNGDDKDYEKYFEKDKVYFKNDTGQDFKINIQQVLEQAKNFKNPPAVNLSPANEMTQAIKSKDEPQKTPQEPSDLQKNISNRPTPNINQSSALEESKHLPEEEPSLDILAQISNWFKSWFYPLLQMLNF